MKGEDLSKQEAETKQKARKEELRDLIVKLEKRFNYVKELEELKEKREREIASPTLELLWRQEYKILQDYIEILKIHEFML